MEKDKLIPGNILFSDHSSLSTTDGNNITVVHDFSPNGSLNKFVQTEKFELIAVDDSCLRFFNRSQGRYINKFAGDCKNAGYRDGTDALFNWPQSVIQDNQTPCLLYVTDFFNAAVRIVTNSRTPYVTTLVKSYLKQYTGITQDHSGQYLYITYSDGLERFDLLRNTSSDIYSRDTTFTNSAAIYDNGIYCLHSIILHEGLIIITDRNQLVVIYASMATYSASLVCTGVAGHLSGNSSFCQLNQPVSLLEMDDDIYIGERGVISRFRGN
mgnify:CR=1 FL=1